MIRGKVEVYNPVSNYIANVYRFEPNHFIAASFTHLRNNRIKQVSGIKGTMY